MSSIFSLFSRKKNAQEIIPTLNNVAIPNNDYEEQLKNLAKFVQSEHSKNIIFSSSQGGELSFAKSFNINTQDHTSLLEYTMTQYKIQLQKLQTIDFKLGLSFVVGLISIALSPLSLGLSSLLTASAFTYFGYQLKQRESVREYYTRTQQDMTNVYIWAMNDPSSILTSNNKQLPAQKSLSHDNAEYVKAVHNSFHPKIQSMHNLFNPMLTDQNILHYTCSKLENAIIDFQSDNNRHDIENETTTKLQLSASYLLYGQHQGSSVQVAKGLFEIIRRAAVDLGINLYSCVKSDVSMTASIL